MLSTRFWSNSGSRRRSAHHEQKQKKFLVKHRKVWSVEDKKSEDAVRFIYAPDQHMDASKRSFLTAS